MNKLVKFILRRLILFIFVFLGLTFVTFSLVHLVPGDPMSTLIPMGVSPEVVERLRHYYGLDQPLYRQYTTYVTNLLRGEFGYSVRTHRYVSSDLSRLFPATIELATFSMLISIVIGIPLGIYTGNHRNKPSDHFGRIFALIGASAPTFWIGIIVQAIFYVKLGFAGPGRLGRYVQPPTQITGMYILDSILTLNRTAFVSSLTHIIMPGFVLGFSFMAVVSRQTRSSMLDALSQDYIAAARSRGLSENRVVYKHALKNALIPTTTTIGWGYGALLSGTVLTETIFAWNGLGMYMVESLFFLDIVGVLGATVLIGIIYSFVNLIVDLLYGVLDPRIRY